MGATVIVFETQVQQAPVIFQYRHCVQIDSSSFLLQSTVYLPDKPEILTVKWFIARPRKERHKNKI